MSLKEKILAHLVKQDEKIFENIIEDQCPSDMNLIDSDCNADNCIKCWEAALEKVDG